MPAATGSSFPKTLHLRNANEFRAVYEKGTKRVSRSLVLFVMPNGLSYSRFGFTTPRKLGKAHDRNRIKRRVREILRTSRELIPMGYDIVVNPRRTARDREFQELRTELLALFGVNP